MSKAPPHLNKDQNQRKEFVKAINEFDSAPTNSGKTSGSVNPKKYYELDATDQHPDDSEITNLEDVKQDSRHESIFVKHIKNNWVTWVFILLVMIVTYFYIDVRAKITNFDSSLALIEKDITQSDDIQNSVDNQQDNRITLIENRLLNIESKIESISDDIFAILKDLSQFGNNK